MAAHVVTLAQVLVQAGQGACASDANLALLYLCRGYAERRVQQFLRTNILLGTYTELHPEHGGLTEDADLVSFEKLGGKAYGYVPGQLDRGRRALVLKNTPVRQVVSVYETWTPGGGFNPGPQDLLDPGAYWPDFEEPPDPDTGYGVSTGGILWKYWTVWPTLVRSIRVTYVAGWTADEVASRCPELAEAVLMTAVKGYRTARAWMDAALGFSGSGPVTSEQIEQLNRYYDAGSVKTMVGQACVLTPEVQGLLSQYVSYSRRL